MLKFLDRLQPATRRRVVVLISVIAIGLIAATLTWLSTAR